MGVLIVLGVVLSVTAAAGELVRLTLTRMLTTTRRRPPARPTVVRSEPPDDLAA